MPRPRDLIFAWDGTDWHRVAMANWQAMQQGGLLLGVLPGDRYFAYCIHDNLANDGTVANIIVHRYTIYSDRPAEEGGRHLLTAAEWRDWDEIQGKAGASDAETDRLHELQRKYDEWFRLPEAAAEALLALLPPPSRRPEHGIHRFLAEHGLTGV
jgi:hypothetical protein